jgi:hypothetical protein
MKDFNTYKREAATIGLSFILFSFLGSGLIFGMYIKYKRLRNYGYKLVLLMTISDIIFMIPNFISYVWTLSDNNYMITNHPNFCYISAYFALLGEIS